MSWFKIDDGFHGHPKVLEAGNEAVGLYVRCGSYCARYLTEGRVPRFIALSYGDMSLVDILVKVGLFEPIEDGWLIHDYHDYNPTKAKVESDRDAAAKRQREVRERARQTREAKAAEAERQRREAEGHTVTHSVTDAVTNGVSHANGFANESGCHAVTHAEVTPKPEIASGGPFGTVGGASDIAPVQNIEDAPSRRDSRVSHTGSHAYPDPTRPVLPTEVREEQNPASADALFDVEVPATASKRAGKPRGSKPKGDEPKADKPNPHAVADGLTRAFYDRHKQRITQPYVALMKIIRVPIANGADRDDLARALDILANEGTAISGGTIRTAMTRVEHAKGARPIVAPQRLSPVDQRFADAIAAGERLEAQARAKAQPPPIPDPQLAQIIQFPQKEIAS